MPRQPAPLSIDARPRGPRGPLATECVLGQSVLEHLLASAGPGPIVVHARPGDLLPSGPYVLETGPPAADAVVLRTDRLYDGPRLRRALRRGDGPETAVIWRLDSPAGLAGAADELVRRRSYQPLGRFWALGPARALARSLVATPVRPNALTTASAGLMLGGAAVVATSSGWPAQLISAMAFALALVLDTADGHLARLQGTASEFGRWLDAVLDELGDMALHAAIAWSAFSRDGHPGWLVLGMLYSMGKYIFLVGMTNGKGLSESPGPSTRTSVWKRWAHLVGHADVRWNLWVVLAALGRLDIALVIYAVYFPGRALAGAIRKGARRV